MQFLHQEEENILYFPIPGLYKKNLTSGSSDPKLQKISEKTGLSTTSILKIIAIADVRKSYIFDAHQLAECLGITVRSARRIMNKIMEAGYGKVYAKKTAAAGGRPKALVEILFKI